MFFRVGVIACLGMFFIFLSAQQALCLQLQCTQDQTTCNNPPVVWGDVVCSGGGGQEANAPNDPKLKDASATNKRILQEAVQENSENLDLEKQALSNQDDSPIFQEAQAVSTITDDFTPVELNRGDTKEDATRDNVIVDPASGQVTFTLPLPYTIKGRMHDLPFELTFKSGQNNSPRAFGHYWNFNFNKFLTADSMSCDADKCNPKSCGYNDWLSSVPRFYEKGFASTAWTNSTAIETVGDFEDKPPLGLPSGNNYGCFEIQPPIYTSLGSVGKGIHLPRYKYNLVPGFGVAKKINGKIVPVGSLASGASLSLIDQGSEPILIDPKCKRNSVDLVRFFPPLGDNRELFADCSATRIRNPDGMIYEYDRFGFIAEEKLTGVDSSCLMAGQQQGPGNPPTEGNGPKGPCLLCGGGLPTSDEQKMAEYLSEPITCNNPYRTQAVCKLRYIRFPNQDLIQLIYNDPSDTERLTNIIDVYGRTALTINYIGVKGTPIDSIVDMNGNVTKFTYHPDQYPNDPTNYGPLASVTFGYNTPSAQVWRFEYTSHNKQPLPTTCEMFSEVQKRGYEYIDTFRVYFPENQSAPAIEALFQDYFASIFTDPLDPREEPRCTELRLAGNGSGGGYTHWIDLDGDGQKDDYSFQTEKIVQYNYGPVIPSCDTSFTTTVTDSEGLYRLQTFDWLSRETERIDVGLGANGEDLVTRYDYYEYYPQIIKTHFPNGNTLENIYQFQLDDALSKSYYSPFDRDWNAGGNLLETIRDSQINPLPQPVVESWSYDPIYQKVRTHTDPLNRVTENIFDYQDADVIEPYLLFEECRWGFHNHDPSIADPLSFYIQGDVNNDGFVSNYPNLQLWGNIVQTRYPIVTQGSLTKSLNAGQDQVAVRNFSYNLGGQLVWERDELGRYTEYQYHPYNDPNGDGANIIVGGPLLKGGGYLSKTIVDANPNAAKEPIADALSLTTSYSYDELANKLWEKDPNGNYSLWKYDNFYRVTDEVNGAASTNWPPINPPAWTKFTYDLNNNLVREAKLNNDSVTGNGGYTPGWFTTRYGYDLMDNLRVKQEELIDPRDPALASQWPTTFWHVDGNGNVIEKVSPMGRSVSFQYDALSRLTQQTAHLNLDPLPSNPTIPAAADPNDPTVTLGYDLNSNRNSVTVYGSTRDYTTTLTYDPLDRVIRKDGPDGRATTQVLDAAGQIIESVSWGHRDPADPSIVELAHQYFFYDERGRDYETQSARFEWRRDPLTLQWLYTDWGTVVEDIGYDTKGQVIAERNGRGYVTSSGYDGAGRLIRKTLPLFSGFANANETQFLYDNNGNQIFETKIEWSHDDLYQEVSRTYPTENLYDSLNRLIETRKYPELSQTGPTLISAFEYNSLGQQTGVWTPAAMQTADPHGFHGRKLAFDTLARQVVAEAGYSSAAGNRTFSTGALDTTYNADGIIHTQVDYDLDGLVVVQRDDKDNATQSFYDNAGRLIKLTYADNSYESLSYYREGVLNTESRTGKSGMHLFNVVYTYDTAMRKQQVDYIVDQMTLSGVIKETFGYDGLDRVINATAESDDPYASANIVASSIKSYDALSNILSDWQTIKSKNGANTILLREELVRREFDHANNRTSLRRELTNGTVLSDLFYQYDELNRILSIERSGNLLHSFEYLGSTLNVDQQNNGNNTTKSIGIDGIDAYGRLITLLHKKPDQSKIAEFTYTYDVANNPLTEIKTHDLTKSQAFSFDVANRLLDFTQADPSQFGTAQPLETFNLDGVGNWRKHIGLANNVNNMNEYTGSFDGLVVAYDERGNLTQYSNQVYTYDAKGRIVGAMVGVTPYSYAFDTEGRRVCRVNAGKLELFIQEGAREISKFDAATGISSDFVYGVGVDEILSIHNGLGANFYLHANRIGSTMAVTNSGGSIVEKYDYSPYGVTLLSQDLDGAGLVSPLRFAGRRQDEGSNLYFMRARYYRASMGRFTSRDSIGLWGDANNYGNAYTYVGSNPLLKIDPSGKSGEPIDNSGVPEAFLKSYGPDIYENISVNAKESVIRPTTAPHMVPPGSPSNPDSSGGLISLGGAVAISLVNPLPGPEDVVAGGIMIALGVGAAIEAVAGANIEKTGKEEAGSHVEARLRELAQGGVQSSQTGTATAPAIDQPLRGAEHTKNASPSKREDHQKSQSRKKADQERADKRKADEKKGNSKNRKARENRKAERAEKRAQKKAERLARQQAKTNRTIDVNRPPQSK